MKSSVFYQLPVAPGQDVQSRYRDTIAQVRHADALGYHAAWLAEGHFVPSFSVMPSPLTVAASLASVTSSIRLGIGVSQLPLHHPLALAEMGATVDVLSGGRLDFGVGRGSISASFAAFGVPWHERDTRFLETLDIIEQAWTQPEVNYRGQYYQVHGVPVHPRPVQVGGVPIHLAANSPQSARFAGERGLSMMLAAMFHPWPHGFLRHVESYQHGAELAGTLPRVSAVFWVFVGKDMDSVRRIVAPSLRHHSIGAAVPFDVAAQSMAIFGSPAQCADKIGAMAESGLVDELICWFNPGGLIEHGAVMDSMSLFWEEVLPSAGRAPMAASCMAS